MTDKKLFLFVVEGADRETGIFDNITTVFFNDKSDIIALPVPADMNIYMLYKIMKEDNFETDIVELLKEKVPDAKKLLEKYNRNSFAEIYYIFDFDEHSNNLRNKDNIEALNEMFEMLNNETELGKLYISYPMIEALRDYNIGDCGTANGSCFRLRSDFGTYKEDSSCNPNNNNISKYDYADWKNVIANYVFRLSCLFRFKQIDRDTFVNKTSPKDIFDKELIIYDKTEKVFILSCLPEFLIDYSENYWNSVIGKQKKPNTRPKCKLLDDIKSK